MKNQAFTLIEILVVVLIIGILAAIAVPQYQKSVLKSRFVQGYLLVDSLYQAEQPYFLTHGKYATNIDDLDVSVPKNSSCTKTQDHNSFYVCDFGRIGLSESGAYIEYIYRPNGNNTISYIRVLKDWDNNNYNLHYKAGERYCYASAQNSTATARGVCESLGGKPVGTSSAWWNYYKLK